MIKPNAIDIANYYAWMQPLNRAELVDKLDRDAAAGDMVAAEAVAKIRAEWPT